jgi:oxygen-independent coproporphyrinogen-3 oxidase
LTPSVDLLSPRPASGPGLYLHIPFCRRKCPYCDFFSRPATPAQLAKYPELLIRQMERVRSSGPWREPFATVFFGGGTPSLLPPSAVAALLRAADRLFGLTAEAEISLEANPGTVTAASLAGYRAAGVNRLSLGVQSLDDRHLARLGRLHSAAEARRAVRWARTAGFANLSCDLMFALPGQTTSDALAGLERFLELQPDHLSCYGLSIEPGTPFARQLAAGHLARADEDVYAETFLGLHHRLTQAGFEHYEISNYSRPGHTCRHNLHTWRRGAYLGLGPGAHSFIERGWGERRAAEADMERFAAAVRAGRDPSEPLETFDRAGAMAETLYLGLRLGEGIDEKSFRARFGLAPDEAFPHAWARTRERLITHGSRQRFDLTGWLLFDHLISAFL